MSVTNLNLDATKDVNITFTKGYTFDVYLRLSKKNTDPVEYYDLTQYIFELKCKFSSYDESAAWQFATNEITKNSSGELFLRKEAAVTNLISPATYVYELRATKTSDGTSSRIMAGKMIVKDAVND